MSPELKGLSCRARFKKEVLRIGKSSAIDGSAKRPVSPEQTRKKQKEEGIRKRRGGRVKGDEEK